MVTVPTSRRTVTSIGRRLANRVPKLTAAREDDSMQQDIRAETPVCGESARITRGRREGQ
jgi:hypothetical protein